MTPDAIAREALGAITSGAQIAPFSSRIADLGLAQAYAVAAALRGLRAARGERAVGRKIGFTNRTIWAQYGVYAPIWGDIYSTTVHDIAGLPGAFPLGRLPEPQIEPEIVFKLAVAPDPAMDEAALAECIAWVAQGFEIVQSPFPGWRFTAADSVTAGGLHGALLVGPPQPIAEADRAAWVQALGRFEVELSRDEAPVDRGGGADVLGHPLSALRHLVGLLAADPDNPPLTAGEIVTTGTLTRAFRVAPGERWSTRNEGLPLAGIAVAFE